MNGSKAALWIAVVLLLGWHHPAVASDLRTLAQADDLCRWAAPQESMARAGDETTEDFVLSAVRRHQYLFARSACLLDVYTVSLDTQVYRFLPDQQDLLTVDTLAPFTLFEGTYELDLGDAAELVFTGSEEDIETVRAGYGSDQVLLRVTFQLASADNPDLPYCSESREGVTRIEGRLLTAELVTRPNNEVLMGYQNDRHLDRVVRFGQTQGGEYLHPQPHVMVSNITFPEGPPPSAEAEYLRLEVESRSLYCYLLGLNLNGRLQGAIVLSSRIDPEGLVESPSVLFDAVNHPMLTGCVTQVIEQITIPRASPADPYLVRMNMIFRLE